ncbi:MAG: GntR family transcriptional regulator [Halofilum sp. (in: g-proteobacteria)]|nr:GntR family transcriptional regulator [Halofilum sp. (in: g-proteobacteria)]
MRTVPEPKYQLSLRKELKADPSMKQDGLYDNPSSGLSAEEEAYTHILAGIRKGRYEPGDRLKAEDIASAIGLSRMPVREALRRLSAEGLLIMRPNRGATVCTLTLADIEEIFEMRAVLEGLAVRVGTPRMNENAVDDLENLLARMERSRHRKDAAWLAYHRQFHEYICGLSGRPRLVRQIASLHTALEPYLRIWFVNTEMPVSANAQKEHREVIDAMRAGDPWRAESVMQEHVHTTAPDLARHL